MKTQAGSKDSDRKTICLEPHLQPFEAMVKTTRINSSPKRLISINTWKPIASKLTSRGAIVLLLLAALTLTTNRQLDCQASSLLEPASQRGHHNERREGVRTLPVDATRGEPRRTITDGEVSLTGRHSKYHNIKQLARGESLLLEDVTTTTTSSPPPAPPDFEEPIGNHTVAVGRDVQLSCKILNLGNFRTAWLRVEDKGILTIHNNVITRNYRFGLLNNEEESNFILTIKNVQPSDKGGYMCQINSVPMKYAVGYLDVLTAPVFDEGVSSNALDVSSDSSSSSMNEGELNDSVAAASIASNNSSQVTVKENSSATLTCRASGHPAPSITWRREDGRPILLNGIDSSLDNSPIEIKDSTSITFSSIHRTNSGAYLCIASNGVQPSASKRQLLDVQFSPIVTLPRAEVAGQLGQKEARLECLVELNPLGSYHWVKLATTTTNTDRRPMVANQEDDLWLIEHDALLQSDKFDIVMKQVNSEKVQMVLTIRNIEKQDFSWYKCVARNSLGLQSSFIRFYETSGTPSPPPAPSSSFSFNSMFRGGSSSSSNSQPSQLEDSQASSAARPHTRSSWIQRSTSGGSSGSRSRLEPSASAASSAETVFNFPTIHCHFRAVLALVPYLVGLVSILVAQQRTGQITLML